MAKNTGIAQFSEGRSDIHRVDPRKLVIIPGWNTRDEGPDLEAHIDMLAQSIAEVGVKMPIQVKLENGQMIVKAGHCRTRATLRAIDHYKAEIKTVPVISVDRYANDADLILEQIITNSGKPLTPLEEAKVYKKLLDMGWQQGEIAKKVGKSQGRVSQILELLTMPEPVKALVAAGNVSASLAIQTVKASETHQEAAQILTNAVSDAKAEGREKVKPADVGMSQNQKPRTFKMCFDNSEIDNSDPDSGFVMIKMPIEDFEVIRQALKL